MNDQELWQGLTRYGGLTPRRVARGAWAAAGLCALIVAAFVLPGSRALPAGARWALTPLCAVLLVESFGYGYHRFFQHVGWLTRRSRVIRRNQMYHWIHHMVIYPIGRFYQRNAAYISSETGLALSWVVPGWIAAAAVVAALGPTAQAALFIASVAAYAKWVIELTHARFHLKEHPWMSRAYFRWLEDIHLLHHWDQDRNFTIVHPAMDWLFGTYLAPRTHQRELAVCREDRELTVSDLTNWRYLLKEATPAEHAAFISQARRHPRSLRKLDLLTACLLRRLERFPGDEEARDLLRRAEALLALARGPSAAAA